MFGFFWDGSCDICRQVQATVMIRSAYYTFLSCTIFIRFLKIFRFQHLNTSLGSGEWARIDPKQFVSNMDRSNCMVRLQSLDMSMSSHCRFSRLCQPGLPAVVLSDQTNHFLTFVPVTNIPSQRGGGGWAFSGSKWFWIYDSLSGWYLQDLTLFICTPKITFIF